MQQLPLILSRAPPSRESFDSLRTVSLSRPATCSQGVCVCVYCINDKCHARLGAADSAVPSSNNSRLSKLRYDDRARENSTRKLTATHTMSTRYHFTAGNLAKRERGMNKSNTKMRREANDDCRRFRQVQANMTNRHVCLLSTVHSLSRPMAKRWKRKKRCQPVTSAK